MTQNNPQALPSLFPRLEINEYIKKIECAPQGSLFNYFYTNIDIFKRLFKLYPDSFYKIIHSGLYPDDKYKDLFNCPVNNKIRNKYLLQIIILLSFEHDAINLFQFKQYYYISLLSLRAGDVSFKLHNANKDIMNKYYNIGLLYHFIKGDRVSKDFFNHNETEKIKYNNVVDVSMCCMVCYDDYNKIQKDKDKNIILTCSNSCSIEICYNCYIQNCKTTNCNKCPQCRGIQDIKDIDDIDYYINIMYNKQLLKYNLTSDDYYNNNDNSILSFTVNQDDKQIERLYFKVYSKSDSLITFKDGLVDSFIDLHNNHNNDDEYKCSVFQLHFFYSLNTKLDNYMSAEHLAIFYNALMTSGKGDEIFNYIKKDELADFLFQDYGDYEYLENYDDKKDLIFFENDDVVITVNNIYDYSDIEFNEDEDDEDLRPSIIYNFFDFLLII